MRLLLRPFAVCFYIGLILQSLPAPLHADVRLPSLIGDHMVVQRGKPIRLWGWADAGEQVTASFGDASATATADTAGQWQLSLPARAASTVPQALTITATNTIVVKDVLVGEVWLCSGQSNMEWPMTKTSHGGEEIPVADHPQIRLFDVSQHIKKPRPQDDAPGTWQACSPESVAGFSAVGYHFGKSLHAALDVPVGLIGSNWGGTQIEPWTPKVGLDRVPSLASPNTKNGDIYNGMVHPLTPWSLRGIIWYQGESNCLKGDTTIYTDRTQALVEGWRTVFEQDDLPFYFVQIAPFTYVQKFKQRNPGLHAESLPRFWEAQQACTDRIPNCGMVVVSDITGDVSDIHPRNKRDVGKRLAHLALAKTYGHDDVVSSGPRYEAMNIAGSEVHLQFACDQSPLASLDGEPLREFMIASADKQFVPATAVIRGSTVIVQADSVPTPQAVRFAWQETALGNLGNQAGLPAPAFRTDQW